MANVFKTDLSGITAEKVEKYFSNCMASSVKAGEEGLVIEATEASRDPSVLWKTGTWYRDTEGKEFSAEEIKGIVMKIRAEHPGYFEIFYTAGDIQVPTGGYDFADLYCGANQWEYVFFDMASEGEKWQGKFNDNFRLDWTNYCMAGDKMTVGEICLFEDANEAKAYAGEGNKGIESNMGEVVKEPDFPERAAKPGYYVCLYERRLKSVQDNIYGIYPTLEEAKEVCESKKVYGYRVSDRYGNLKYLPYTLLQCNMLREGKWVTDYVRLNNFTYGDAPINPAIDCRAKKVSCDRLVNWILYRLGFVDQQLVQGIVVSVFHTWCEKLGFTLITDYEKLEPGDVMLVRPHVKGFALHAYMFAGYSDAPEIEPDFPQQPPMEGVPKGPDLPVMYSFRYDCGSDARIQSVQPSKERLFPGAYTPVFVYRPVVTKENNIFADYYMQNK